MNKPLVALLVAACVGLGWSLTPDKADPQPKPDPPKPVVVEPPPRVEPVPAKLHVLILEETSRRPSLPLSQVLVLESTTLREWFKSNGADWRIWDKDVDVTFESPDWQKAKHIVTDSLPWMVVVGGKKTFNGPLPKTLDETLSVLNGCVK